MENSKSPVAPSDPIQSLVQQLTSRTNTQHQQIQQHKVNSSNKPDVAGPWGVPPINSGQALQQGQWGTHHNHNTPWGYGDQNVIKMVY